MAVVTVAGQIGPYRVDVCGTVAREGESSPVTTRLRPRPLRIGPMDQRQARRVLRPSQSVQGFGGPAATLLAQSGPVHDGTTALLLDRPVRRLLISPPQVRAGGCSGGSFSGIAAQPFQSPSGSRLDSWDGVVAQPRHSIDIAVYQSLRDHLQRHLTGSPMLVFERVDHCRRRGLVPGVQHRSKRPGPYEVTLGTESELDPARTRTARDVRHQLRLVAPVHLSVKTYTAVHQPARPPPLDGQPDQHGRMGVERQVEVCHNPIIAGQLLAASV
jgi:hypothetical protein